MQIFQYGQKEIQYLKESDSKLGEAIDRIGMIRREIIPDLFTALIRNIVAQQISSAAASTVWSRLKDRFGEIDPERIANTTLEDIQACGMSMRKAEYIQGIGQAVFRGELDLSALEGLPDNKVIKALSSLRGVGVWTAEMLLIFSMQRPDIVSWGDLAIRRGMMTLYGLETLDKKQFDKYRKAYTPYGSVASLYLWHISRQK
ncbi:MAG: DNA-3-methyladenine glycosylase 2 family protein [Clostridiales bacterium]|nr:DNA-3-methyladenine glycosylase 2 family protein [Clostridiales bacterium]